MIDCNTENSKKPRNSWQKGEVITWLVERGEMYDEIAGESMCLLLERCKRYCIEQRFMVGISPFFVLPSYLLASL